MTNKDYELAAKLLHTKYQQLDGAALGKQVQILTSTEANINFLCEFFSIDNPAFDANGFRKAVFGE